MCTNLSIKPANIGGIPNYISARTMDFKTVFPWHVMQIPRDMAFPPIPLVGNPFKWKNKYGFVAIGTEVDKSSFALKIPFYGDGLNEAGLSAATLWLPHFTQYPTAAILSHNLFFGNLAAWALGCCASVEEVRDHLLQHEFHIAGYPALGDLIAPIHFIFQDAKGQSLIVEFIDGKVMLHDCANGVMTNAPDYPWQLNNLSTTVQMSLHNKTFSFNGEEAAEINGSGLLGLPADATPPSRFIRATKLAESTYSPQTSQDAVGLALQILGNFFVPSGTVLDKETNEQKDFTQWGVVRDHTNKVFYFTSAFNHVLRGFSLNQLDFTPGNKIKSIPLMEGWNEWFVDVKNSFQ
jgi:choloylglycine hydrolase